MFPQLLAKLDLIGKKLVQWEAEQKLTLGLSVIVGWVWALGLVDLWLRLDRTGRMATWTILLALVVATLWLVRGALRLRFTPEAVAATLEKTFPQLDNRLINILQFGRNPDGDIFKAAYVRGGAPEWQNLDFRKMRDEKAHRRNRILLTVVAVLMLLPALFFGQAWGVAVWRTVNPFSNIEPQTLTKILKVEPGTSSVLQGRPLTLSCTAQGFSGHEVKVEVEPAGAKKTIYSLGHIAGGKEQEFSYPIEKVTAGLRYRFIAGDARKSDWYAISTRPPPAFTSISVTIRPPAYTKLPVRKGNPRDGVLTAPYGSEVRIVATSNAPLEKLRMFGAVANSVPFVQAEKSTVWRAEATLASGSSLVLKGEDTYCYPIEENVPFQIEPDKPPAIEILSPNGKAILPPGGRPQIEFRVSDAFGLSDIAVEEVTPDSTREDKGSQLAKYDANGEKDFHRVWTSSNGAKTAGEVAYRIVARDNRPGEPNESFSPNVVFTIPTQAEFQKFQKELEKAALASLQKLIDMQKLNLSETQSLFDALDGTTAPQWAVAADRQKQIRTLMHDLLENPLKPLGGLTEKAQKLYGGEMLLAIDALQSVPNAQGTRKQTLAKEALDLENAILKRMSFAISAMENATVKRDVSGLDALLETMLREQSGALKETLAFAESKAKVAKTLVDAQDRIGREMADFLAACKAEAAGTVQSDKGLSDAIGKMMARAEELKIRTDMVVSAERLDQNMPAEASPMQQRAISGLKSLQAMLAQVKVQEDKENRAAMVDAVQQAKEKLAKLEALATKLKEAMEAVKAQGDKDDKEIDAMNEEFAEVQKNIQEAMLEVPTDLHIFTDLNASNDLVEDVFSVFQEVDQPAGSEKKQDPSKTTQWAIAKDEAMLQAMGEAKGRLDQMEMWLGNKPEDFKVTTESFDKAEMPESGVAQAELAAAAQDLVGDLVKEEKKSSESSNDGATNHALPDWEAGWEVAEGDVSSFGAQGKSGNQTPDHKEQDGRSNVGRQGMSTGETAAGSGTIGKGDDNIEARRTQDPVQSGQIDLSGKADTKATGGGKLGTGKADGVGMSGGAKRVDSKEKGSNEGMAALMAKRADELFAKASTKNVRTGSLKDAAHELRQSADAIAKGDIGQMKEFRKQAISSLTRAQADLSAGPSQAMEAKGSTGALNNVIQSGPDQVPQKFRDKVADYYKALNGAY